MANCANEKIQKHFFSGFYSDRRSFLRTSTFAALAAVGMPVMAKHLEKFDTAVQENKAGVGTKNSLPGRIVLLHDPSMLNAQFQVESDQVEAMVKRSVQLLTQISGTGQAFASLFPGVQTNSKIAIKVNCLGPVFTRWEVARGVVSGLSQMLNNTYDISNVTLYDDHNLHNRGYDESNFLFNGHTPTLSDTNNASGSGYEAVNNYALSQILIDADYVINLPVLKSHSDANNQITVALKNHYGSCSPASLCGNIAGMLTLNSDQYIKDKTCLVLTDALIATWYGGPSSSPQLWSTYDEQTPSTLLVSTDPITNDYWARQIINTERVANGDAEKTCPWIEQASGVPYEIGVSDPEQMMVIEADAENHQGAESQTWGSVKARFR